MAIFMFVLSVIMLFTGHYLKKMRWSKFIEIYEKPDDAIMLRALSYGYFINFIIPYHLGEIVRAVVVGKKSKNGTGFSLATVIIDRFLDVIVVSIIFLFMSLNPTLRTDIWESALSFLVLSCFLIIMLIICSKFSYAISIFVKNIVSIFNAKIELKCLAFVWSLIMSFKNLFKISVQKLLTYTVSTWTCYMLSYYFFALFLSKVTAGSFEILDIFIAMFAKPNFNQSTLIFIFNTFSSKKTVVFAVLYILLPLIALIIVSLLSKKEDDNDKGYANYINLLPYTSANDRLTFLLNYFSDSNKSDIMKLIKLNENVNIIQDYSAGSNATTMLCMDKDHTFYRKYAFGKPGLKLAEQIKWINDNKNRLPLPVVLSVSVTDDYACYDMEYNSLSVGLFKFMHSHPTEATFTLIKSAITCLNENLYTKTICETDTSKIQQYVEQKAIKNLNFIKKQSIISQLLVYDTIIINGIEYKNLPLLEKYLSKEHLCKLFENDICCEIHGDLTVENIICNANNDGSFYFIDPNGGNIHNSQFLDYGKLLQSLHGNYEFLMTVTSVLLKKNRIDFFCTPSSAYSKTRKFYVEYLNSNFTFEQVRSIFYHEIIHWLRLLPYKLSKKSNTALAFYAGFIMVANDIFKKYEDDFNEK